MVIMAERLDFALMLKRKLNKKVCFFCFFFMGNMDFEVGPSMFYSVC